MARDKVQIDDAIRTYMDFDIDIPNRTIFMGDEISVETANRYIKALTKLDTISHEPIHILLNSPGGDVVQGLAIYDIIQQLKSFVTITVIGECASMAVGILQAADERVINRHGYLMVHYGNAEIGGHTQKTLQNWYAHENYVNEAYDVILLARMQNRDDKMTMAKVKSMMKDDTIIYPREAIRLGLVDRILGSE